MTRLDERRNRLKPGTCRRRSSTVWLADRRMSSRVRTVTLAGASPAFCSMRVTVTTTGSRRVGSSGGCAAAGETARRLRSSAEKHRVIWRRAGDIVGRACYTRGRALTSPRPRRIVRAAK